MTFMNRSVVTDSRNWLQRLDHRRHVEALQQRVFPVVVLSENMSNCVGDVGSWRCLLSKRLQDSLEQRAPRRFRFPLRPWAERSRRRP